jgi:PAS domain-containing protein
MDFDPLQSSLNAVRARLKTLLHGTPESPATSSASGEIQTELEKALQELNAILDSNEVRQHHLLASQAQQQAQELNAIFTSMADAVIVYDRDGKVQRVSPVARKLVEFEPAGLDLPSIVQRLDVHYPDGTPVDVSDLPSSHALRGEEVREIHLVVTSPSGRKYHILSTGSPLYTNGVFSGAVVTWRDSSVRTGVI